MSFIAFFKSVGERAPIMSQMKKGTKSGLSSLREESILMTWIKTGTGRGVSNQRGGLMGAGK